nr:PREDICTED: aminopeptidase N-like [Linepithema humile]
MALRNISLNIKLLFIVIIFFSIPQFINSDSEVNYHSLNYTGLVPLHYDVKIELDFERNILFGECNITINITRQITNISIPSKNFGILKIDVINNDDSQMIIVPDYSFIDETHIYIDFTNSPINVLFPGTYILEIIYVCSIFDDDIFLESYKEEIGEKQLIETGVELMRAQQIFPCWNESAFETTFTVSIKHDKTYTALSNMIINMKEYDNENNMMWTHFVKSPFMSIGHLTIVITSLHYIPSFNTSIKIWNNVSMSHNILYVQKILFHVMNILQSKTWAKISKIDYVVIWDVQQFNNIETWGFIIQRGEDITVDEELDSISYKIEVASLVTRQIISVWYYDLLWPIEGFTTYLTAYILRKIPLLSDIYNLFIVQVQQESFRFDIPSYTNTTLNNNNDLSVETNKAFLNYIKPPILWHILQRFLNREALFWKNIGTYCYKYNQSVKTDDLWHIMQTNLNQTNSPQYIDVKKYIDIWTKTNYYPVIYAERNNKNNTMLFTYLSSDFDDKDVEQQLPVLVTFKAKLFGQTHKRAFWLLPQKTSIIGGLEKYGCVIVNVEQSGYYRVNYDSESWLKLGQCLISENYKVHALNQAQIIDDAFYFLTNRQLSITTFWNLARFLSNNTNYIVWYPMIKAFEYMVCVFSLDTMDVTLNMINILNKTLQVIGYNENPDESTFTKCLREEVAKWACILDVAECRKAATLQLIKDLQSPVQDNRVAWKEWKYCSGLMSANYTIWNHTFQRWETTSDNRILDYLTCCKDPFIVTTFLNQIIGLTSIIKEQNMRVNIVLLTIAKHVKNHLVLDFLLRRLESNQFNLCGNRDVDLIVTLIVIITNIHVVEQLEKINNFATYLEDGRFFDVVKKQTKKRRVEYSRQNKMYGSLMIR